MKSPLTGKEMTLKIERRTSIFRKVSIEIVYHYYLCNDTGEKFVTDELTDLNLTQVHNKYREICRIPFPDEIIETRNKYGLSAAMMSEILGFGINTYRNYEQGEIPTLSNAKLIRLANDPCEFLSLVNISSLPDKPSINKLKKRIEEMMRDQYFNFNLTNLLLNISEPNIYTGFRMPNFKKIYNLIKIFALKLSPWKTQLNKLFFYTDFNFFNKTGFSLTGLKYVAIDRGPVLNRYEVIFDEAVFKGFVNRNDVVFSNGKEGCQYINNDMTEVEYSLFSEEEMNIINTVIIKYGKLITKDLINLSHEEKAWIDNVKDRNIISYEYGFELTEAIK